MVKTLLAALVFSLSPAAVAVAQTAEAPVAERIAAELEAIAATADASARTRAIYDVTRRWASEAPVAAYDAIAASPPGALRDEIEGVLLSGWMAVDTAAALRFVAALDVPPPRLLNASRMRGAISGWLFVSPDSDLLELFDIAGALPAEIGASARMQLLRRIAQQEPRTAAELVTRLPLEERRQNGTNVARDFAAADPEAALAWARELGIRDVEDAVIEGMAARDPYGMLMRATAEEAIGLGLVATGALAAPTLDKAQFGTALAQLPRTAESAAALSSFTQSWLVRDQQAALDWLAGVGVDMPREAILRAANRVSRDPAVAAAYALRLEGQNRSEWIDIVATAYGREDPARALEWLEPFRTDPAYARVAAKIVPNLASSNGPRAAQLFQALAAPGAGAPWGVTREWAKSDPVAAARWADGLTGYERSPAVRAAVDEWHSYDPAAAERWARGLPAGPLRDDALYALVYAFANADELSQEEQFAAFDRLLASFDTDAARQTAILGAVTYLLRNRRDAARELAESLTDPALRCRASQLLDPQPGGQGGLFGPAPTTCQPD